MSSDFMTDLTGIMGNQTVSSVTAANSTNKKAGTDLDMSDFLQLMVAMFQNQSIDDVASTSDMMNQMVQMSVIQAVTNMNDLLSESTSLNYAASLVGKEVTIGQYVGSELTELRGVVTGTGTLDGRQVIFIGDDSYWLTDVMAVGRLPEKIVDPDGETVKDETKAAETGAVGDADEAGKADGEAEETGEINEIPAVEDETPPESGDLTTEALEDAAEEILENS